MEIEAGLERSEPGEEPKPEEHWVRQVHETGVGFLPFASKREAIDYARRNPGAKYAGTQRPEEEAPEAAEEKVA